MPHAPTIAPLSPEAHIPIGYSQQTRLEWRAARNVQIALLVLTVAVPMTGWAMASSSPLRIPSYVFDLLVVPCLPIAVSDAAEAFWSKLHEWVAYAAALLIVMHGRAALFHHFHHRDGVLRSILPFIQKG